MVFKSWQIFIFSLVPLALVFIGVIGGSIHGSDSEKEIFPTPPPRPTTVPGAALQPGAPAIPGMMVLVARDLAVDERSTSAAPNSSVTIRLDNQYPDVSLYTNNRAATKIAGGELVSGLEAIDFT